jgi:hypothetical protein
MQRRGYEYEEAAGKAAVVCHLAGIAARENIRSAQSSKH